MKIAHLPSLPPNGLLEVSQGYAFAGEVLTRLATGISSVDSGKGDIEFP